MRPDMCVCPCARMEGWISCHSYAYVLCTHRQTHTQKKTDKGVTVTALLIVRLTFSNFSNYCTVPRCWIFGGPETSQVVRQRAHAGRLTKKACTHGQQSLKERNKVFVGCFSDSAKGLHFGFVIESGECTYALEGGGQKGGEVSLDKRMRKKVVKLSRGV
ncbi:hypothetical protein DM02DRAFT_145300 [Periconia macrospinosa]|uniref:Uncharacterized protein n=1 Tax=Periconia macrospinosa TaxID=97972 RepID=A0A2V1E2V9_9PLEO|nr:hypothetical protein DM02DRAFT_145300 [Periconia macrospinosa]